LSRASIVACSDTAVATVFSRVVHQCRMNSTDNVHVAVVDDSVFRRMET